MCNTISLIPILKHHLFSNYLGNSRLLVHLCDQAHDLSEGIFFGGDPRSEFLHQSLPIREDG